MTNLTTSHFLKMWEIALPNPLRIDAPAFQLFIYFSSLYSFLTRYFFSFCAVKKTTLSLTKSQHRTDMYHVGFADIKCRNTIQVKQFADENKQN